MQMIDFLKNIVMGEEQREEIRLVILDTSEHENMPPDYIVEKDLYVNYVLDFLFNRSEIKDNIEFRGGTSLSKGYNLINRFSEDIDIVYKNENFEKKIQYILDNKDESGKPFSKTKRKKLVEDLREESKDYCKNTILPIIKKGIDSEVPGVFIYDFDDKTGSIFLNYDPIVDYENTYIKPSVRIEIGVREAWTPNESISLNSFIGTVNKENENFQDGWSFKVNVIKPERTFWEKVNILQQESNRDESKDLPERYSRHYYDIYKMVSTQYKKTAIKDIALLQEVIKYTSILYEKNWAKIGEIKPGHFTLSPHSSTLELLKDDYKNMESMIYGEYPSFDEILESVQKLEKELNTLTF